jgi:hypothetical protein
MNEGTLGWQTWIFIFLAMRGISGSEIETSCSLCSSKTKESVRVKLIKSVSVLQ